MIKIYDTMTRSLRDFVPLTENVVNMYVCGPTVYNYIHIGNARSAVAFDTIRRYFEYCGYTVNYISNFTDVDDKIIKAANEAGISTKELSDKFIAAFMEDPDNLASNQRHKIHVLLTTWMKSLHLCQPWLTKDSPMSLKVMFTSE